VSCLTTLSESRTYNVDDRMINGCGAVCGMKTDKENRCIPRKSIPLPSHPLQTPHAVIWHRTQDTVVENRRIEDNINSAYVRGTLKLQLQFLNVVFWDVATCESYKNRRFGGTCRLHLQGRKIRERENC
jgi:hypothetical protein